MVYKILFPNKVTFIGSGDLDIDISFVGGVTIQATTMAPSIGGSKS